MSTLRQYIYSPAEAGLLLWPEGELRLEGFDVTTDPASADVFVVPAALTPTLLDPNRLHALPYMAAHEDRHVFMDVSDHEPLYNRRCRFIRCNARTWYYEADPNTISWAWPVENYAECIEVPASGFRYDVSFHGWISTETRRQSMASCHAYPRLSCDLVGYPDFTGYIYDQPEGIRRRSEFRRSMRESRIMLCGESIPGVFPYRFFEALSAARVPLLISSDYVLPRAHKIPYADFILTLPRTEAHHAGRVIREFLDGTPDAELIERGRLGRQYWERYLNRDDWPRTMAEAVIEDMQ